MECTLRDGSYAIDFQFTAEDTYRICRGLDQAGFGWIEIGHGFGMGASGAQFGEAAASDEQYLRAAAAACREARFGMFFLPGIARHEHLDLAHSYGMGFVRIGTNISRSAEARPYIEHARRLGMTVAYNAMKSYAAPAPELAVRLKQAADWGADLVYVVDSAGGMLPAEVSAYVRQVCDLVPVPVGFHGHNNMQLAVANCLAAIDAGSRMVDTTLQGIGRGGGNAQTEVLVVVLEKLGYALGIDLFQTYDLGEQAVTPLMKRAQGISSLDLTLGRAQFHSSYLPLIEQVAEETGMDPRQLICDVSRVNRENPTAELIRQVAALQGRSDRAVTARSPSALMAERGS
jgi:4-hydroxy-2-oxovalerate aldolase